MFEVVLFSGNRIICLSDDPTLDRPTYNCPWEKHSFRRSMPTKENVCPWDLLIVRANDVFIGNWSRLNGMGRSVGIIGILGMCANWPAPGPMRMVATIRLSFKSFISSLVPLHRLGGLKFLKSMIGVPDFNSSS